MKKLFINFLIASGIILLFFSGATSSEKKYNIVMWDSTDIKAFIDLPNISFAVLNFHKPGLGRYKLSVAAFNSKRTMLRTYSLSVVKGYAADFKNDYTLGLFILKIHEIKSYLQNGVKSLYFAPVPLPDAGSQSYVEYDIYDEPPPYDIKVLSKTPVGTIKPVPPYN